MARTPLLADIGRKLSGELSRAESSTTLGLTEDPSRAESAARKLDRLRIVSLLQWAVSASSALRLRDVLINQDGVAIGVDEHEARGASG